MTHERSPTGAAQASRPFHADYVGSNPSPATLQKRHLTSRDAGQGPLSRGLGAPRFVRPSVRVGPTAENGCDLRKRQPRELAAVTALLLDAHADRLQALTFLDLDHELVEREVARMASSRTSGAHAENMLRDLGAIAAGPV